MILLFLKYNSIDGLLFKAPKRPSHRLLLRHGRREEDEETTYVVFPIISITR